MLDINIENDPNLSEILNDGYTLLEVTFVDINNTGVYKCEIDNIFGMDSSEVFFNTLQGIYVMQNGLKYFHVIYYMYYHYSCSWSSVHTTE